MSNQDQGSEQHHTVLSVTRYESVWQGRYLPLGYFNRKMSKFIIHQRMHMW